MTSHNENHEGISGLVSIVMPAFNCAKFIGYSIESIIQQTYSQWELIIVDDFSSDNTAQVSNEYAKSDGRIKYFKLDKNSGAAIARNTAVSIAQGEYIAFLDSDDLWQKEKLDSQIDFMKRNGYNFTCTAYSKIDEDGNFINRVITPRTKIDYNALLKYPPGNSTVMYNARKLGKFQIPDIRKRNDYVMWLQIIRSAKFLYGMNDSLSSHRIRPDSLSKSKTSLVKYHWKVYREIEKLSFVKSVYLIFYWVIVTLLRAKIFR
jgi:glycosyltransferase involved in cell wall biosynthesis